MAQTGYTPILLYYSTTAAQAPLAANLASGELAINITDGKLYYKDNSGVVQVLAVKMPSGVLPVANGGTSYASYTTGDLLYASGTTALSKLGIGTNGYILTSSGTAPQWTAGSSISVNTATNLAGGSTGSVPYQSGAGATTFLSIGAANTILTSSGSAPQWSTSLTLGGNLAVNGNTTLGDAAADTVTVNGTITSNLIFTDNTYDIGASGATRPRNLYLAGNEVVGGSVTWSGGTANGVAYLDGSKVLTTGSALTFDGTNFATTGTASATKMIPTGGSATGNGMYLPAANTLAWSNNGSETMRLDSSGNLVLGATSTNTGCRLDVVGGNITVDGFGSSYGVCFRRGFETNDNLKIYAKDLGLGRYGGLAISAYDGVVFSTGSNTYTERARIDSSGNFFVNTTAIPTTQGFAVLPYSGGTYTRIAHNTSAGASDGYMQFYYDSSQIGQIQQNGTTAIQYTTTSDYRLKENVQPMTGALAKVAQLKPVTYKWKSDGSDGEGFIAHELQEVVPDCVGGAKDAVDEDGNPIYQGIDTSFLVATLTAAIQELKAEFDAYKATHP